MIYTMKDIILYLLQVSLCTGIFLFIYRIFFRTATFFRFNRIYLLIGLITSFIIPKIQFSYDVLIRLPIVNQIVTESATEVKPVILFDKWTIAFLIYITGVVLLIVHHLLALRRFRQLIKSGTKYDISGYKLISHKDIDSPFSIFRYIFLNTGKVSEVEKDLIIKHEISHISQKHWMDLFCSECARLLQWFNPFIWLYVRYIKENHEYLADNAVIKTGCSLATYQAVLINQRFQGPVFSFSNSFNYSNHLKRLVMIKKTKSSPLKKIFILLLIPIFFLFFKLSAKPNYIIEYQGATDISSPGDDSVKVIGYKLIEKNNNAGKNDNTFNLPPDALYIVDGVECTQEQINTISPEKMESMGVLKGKTALELYGEKGKKGVIIISTKKKNKENIPSVEKETSGIDNNDLPENKTESLQFRFNPADKKSTPYVLIDGIEFNGDINDIDPGIIHSVDVLKNPEIIKEYGEKAKNGVILISTTKSKGSLLSLPELSSKPAN